MKERATPAHPVPVDRANRSTIIFVTVCVKDRRPLLANQQAVSLLMAAWLEADHWAVGDFIVLPDHVHLFCSPARYDALSLQRWVGYWKALVTKAWPSNAEKPLWQRDFWDTQLRSGDHFQSKWLYVRDNPVRHNLVDRWEDWPFRGQVNRLDWHN